MEEGEIPSISKVFELWLRSRKVLALKWEGNFNELTKFVPHNMRSMVPGLYGDDDSPLMVTTPNGPRVVYFGDYIVLGEDVFSSSGFYVLTEEQLDQFSDESQRVVLDQFPIPPPGHPKSDSPKTQTAAIEEVSNEKQEGNTQIPQDWSPAG